MTSKIQSEPNSPVHKVWKPELYEMQLMAPCPKPLQRKSEVPDTPAYYGSVYHGEIGHAEAEEVLADTEDGTYLLRKSPGANDFYTLSMRFGGKTKNYKVYYKPGLGHFLKEEIKQFESINDLVADGLVDHYMRVHAAPIIQKMMLQTKNNYQQSPYMTLNRRKLRALSNDLQISVKKNIETEVKTCEIPSFPINQDETDTHEDDLPIVYEKPHTFKVHTFKGLNWCEFCANFLWGFTAQGVKCEDCGFIAHNKCSELVPAKCVPDLKRIRGVFGTDLTTLVTVHQCTIPFVVRCCVEEIEARGLLQEGIYRVSGFADEIEALKLALDKDGEKTNLSESAYGNVNVIAGVLKLYLRLLPVSLITFQAYPYFMASTRCNSEGEQVLTMREAMKHLPTAHYNCLKYMITHLAKIASHHAINKMTEHNLATVFAPTLIATPPQLTDLSQEIFMLSSLITHHQAVFMQ